MPDCPGHQVGLDGLWASLPQEKFDCTAALLDTCRSTKQHCMRKELEYLSGHLQHACKVVPPGWTFFCVK